MMEKEWEWLGNSMLVFITSYHMNTHCKELFSFNKKNMHNTYTNSRI
jgi:hypothetical protein